MLLLPAVIVLAAGAFLMVKRTDGERNVPPALDDLDGDLCALEVEGVPDATAYLVDLRKPVADALAPGRMLRDIGRQLAAGEELRVFALTANSAAPKRLLGRFCQALRRNRAEHSGRQGPRRARLRRPAGANFETGARVGGGFLRPARCLEAAFGRVGGRSADDGYGRLPY